MFGILNINKPAGWTSRDVVNRVQRFVRPAKAGHAGTLDPLATGVLVVCIGPATKLISYVQQQPKEYLGKFLLGRSSPSDDIETEVSDVPNAPIPSREEVQNQLPHYLGSIQQLPPQFSAVKLAGRRAYDLARKGENVELQPRTVEIYHLEVTGYDYPELELRIRCGSGTYIRSLGRDLARSLGSEAVMSELQRTSIGSYAISESLPVDRISEAALTDSLLAPLTAVEHLSRLVLRVDEIKEISHGRTIAAAASLMSQEETIAAVNADGELVALLREKHPGRLGPISNFASPV